MKQKPLEFWNELNNRQREYLQAVYDLDQVIEQNEKSGNWRRRRVASEWRWIPYTANPQTGGPADLQLALREHDLVDEESGAAWKTLESRGLISCRYDLHNIGTRLETWLFVQMTPFGRKIVRAAINKKGAK